MKRSSAAAAIRWLAVCACALLLPTATVHETTARQPDAQTPEQFFGFPHRHRRRAGALSEDPRVLPAPVEDDQSRQVSGARQDDDGESVRAGDDQRAGEPGEAGPAHRDQPPAGRSARADRGGSEQLAQEGRAFYLRLRDDPLDRGRQHAGADRDRAPARDRQQRRDQADPRQRRRSSSCRRRIRTGSTWSSITGTRRRARRSRASIRTCTTSTSGTTTTATGSCSRRSKRGSRSSSPERVQADHHARHAPAGHRAARASSCRRSTIPTIPNVHPILAQGITTRRQGDGVGAGRGRQGGASSGCRATTCGRRRGSTWSTTASRAS